MTQLLALYWLPLLAGALFLGPVFTAARMAFCAK
jgi:hypothetical protein